MNMSQGSTESTENTTSETTTTQGHAKSAKKSKKQGKPEKVKKERPAREKPAHMSKVDKVASQLPALPEDAQVLFAAANNMSTADMNALVAHLNISIRRRGVQAIAQGSGSNKIEPGQRVRLRSGNPKFVGQTGTVSKVARIHCYVRLDGRSKDDYFFISDCVAVGGAVKQGSLAEVVTRLSSQPAPVDINTIEDEDVNANLDTSSATG